jgi:hypothetical protein
MMGRERRQREEGRKETHFRSKIALHNGMVTVTFRSCLST